MRFAKGMVLGNGQSIGEGKCRRWLGPGTLFRSRCLLTVVSLVLAGIASFADAAILSIRPIHFVDSPGYSMTATGWLDVDLTTSVISSWDLKVTTIERLAHYSKSNTRLLSASGVHSDGSQLTVDTSPDGVDDGGSLFFRSPNPFQDVGALVADFTGSNVSGGQAMYMNGGAFDFLDLNQPNGTQYTVANSPSGSVFDLVPLSFAGGATMTGTITTDGTTGLLAPGNILNWDIYVDQVTEDIFDSSNSRLFSNLAAMNADQTALTVTNPDGYLTFSKGALGGRLYALQLADFTGQRGGQAGYFQGRLGITTLDLHAARGPWFVTGSDPVGAAVPEPSTALIFGACMAFIAGSRLRMKSTRGR